MIVELKEDSLLMDIYNRALYDLDETRYAKFLSNDKYEITDYKIKIKAGERTGRTMIRIHPDGLSPDSTYFIGLKACDVSGVEINDSKNTILYEVLIKNKYASQANNDYYSMTGMANNMVTAGNKNLYPLTANTVRVVAGTESFKSEVSHIDDTSIILKVDTDNKVTIKPYKNLDVVQINGNSRYPNIFFVEESFGHNYYVFLLSYQYTIGKTTKVMQEELRIEVAN